MGREEELCSLIYGEVMMNEDVLKIWAELLRPKAFIIDGFDAPLVVFGLHMCAETGCVG